MATKTKATQAETKDFSQEANKMKKAIIVGLLAVIAIGMVAVAGGMLGNGSTGTGLFAIAEGTSDHEHDDEHDHSVEIEGKDLKLLTVQEVAYLWEIDSEILLSRMTAEFDLKESYTVHSVLEDIRAEYAFSPALIKDMAEEIKEQGAQNE